MIFGNRSVEVKRSLSTLSQQKHQRLLERLNAEREQPESDFVQEIREYILWVRKSSEKISDPIERDQLRANLIFWATFVFDKTHEYPDIDLRPSSVPILEKDPELYNIGLLNNPRLLTTIIVGAIGLLSIVGCIAIFFIFRAQPQPTQQATVVIQVTKIPTLTPSSTAVPSATAIATLDPNNSSGGGGGESPTPDLTATFINRPQTRSATISEIRGSVQMKSPIGGDFATVTQRLTVPAGTIILTGEDSSVKITLTEGTVIRAGSQTQFKIDQLSGTTSNPVTKIKLDFGKVWSIVGGPLGTGTYDVQTPLGTASVIGSFMSIESNPTEGLDIIGCLEGKCKYFNDKGVQNLITLQQLIVKANTALGSPQKMDVVQVNDWAPTKVTEVVTLTPIPTATETRTPTGTRLSTGTPNLTATSNSQRTTLTLTPVGTQVSRLQMLADIVKKVSDCNERKLTINFDTKGKVDASKLAGTKVTLIPAGNTFDERLILTQVLDGSAKQLSFDLSSLGVTKPSSYLLLVANSEMNFSSVIVQFESDCSLNQIVVNYVAGQSEFDYVRSLNLDLRWRLITWGPSALGDRWIAKLRLEASGGDGQYIFWSGSSYLPEPEIILSADSCDVAIQSVGVSSGGRSLIRKIVLQSPYCLR